MIYCSSASATVTTSPIVTANSIWIAWNEAITCSTPCVIYCSADTAWSAWNNCSTVTASVTYASGQVSNHAPVLSLEELQRQQESAQRAAEQYRQRQALLTSRRTLAANRARDFLLSHLEPQQAKQYKKDKFFEVLARASKRRYRIYYGMAGNITVFEGERAVETLCIHTPQNLPYEDNMLAQKLMLETNEALFRKTANITRLAA